MAMNFRQGLMFFAALFSPFASGGLANASPSSPSPTSGANSSQPSLKIALSLCGSNTIGSQLGPDLAGGFLSSMNAQNPISHVSAVDEQTVEADLNGRQMTIHVAAHGSATAFEGMRAGDCQIGMASRRIKPAEAGSLRSLGNMTSPNSEHVIGLDGIAVIVNATNPLSSLTISQLKDIFTGRITEWKAVGGGSGRIAVRSRNDKSGTYDTFKSLVLDRAPLVAGARRYEDSATLSASVSLDQNAIGFVGLPYVNHAKALRVASGGAPIAPTALTVGRETYPLTRRLFLYTAASPKDPLVTKFVSFVQSDAGQRIVNRDGFVGTVTSLATMRSSSKSLPSGAPPRYRRLVDSFDQASFDFYFDSGSDVLDNKALVDVRRLVALLSSGPKAHKQVVLAGFADSTGDPASNLALSESRAQAAASVLEAQGIRVKETMGFGQQLPIRDNTTEAGREKNRRVEIFTTR
ncbi:MAG: substrate-binding domain-containing protein [Vulcanimicrobiaceae bacterium]